jgi:hypothetical protein
MFIQKRKLTEGTTEKHKFYQIIKGIMWNREIEKQCKTICEVYFKSILTYNGERETNKSKQWVWRLLSSGMRFQFTDI